MWIDGKAVVMRRIGLIGGISWAASAVYYRLLNEQVQRALGKNHSADLVLRSMDMQPLLDAASDIVSIETIFEAVAGDLAAAGAEILAVASFTGHRYVRPLAACDATFVDLIEVVADELVELDSKRVALLATSYALRDKTLMDRLRSRSGCELIFQHPDHDTPMDALIFGELAHGRLGEAGRALLRDMVTGLTRRGADRLLLATTDFSHVMDQIDTELPTSDATSLHCRRLVKYALDCEAAV